MTRLVALLVLPAILGTLAAPEPAAPKKKPKPRAGVFGTINGRKFDATNLQGAGDPCVGGIYKPAEGIIVFTALECKPKRRRQGVAAKKNYKIMVISCTKFDGSVDTSTFPYELPCPSSVYEENKTGRFGISKAKTQWGANAEFPQSGIPTSNLHVRVDGFDGSTLRGVLTGVFEVPISGAGSSTPAQISDEVSFSFPFKVQ